jgi:hypothetical protein
MKIQIPFIPAKARTQNRNAKRHWIPAFAGMNGELIN